MNYITLLAAMVASSLLSIMSSLFGRQNTTAKNTSYLYSVVVTFSATITWAFICLVNGEFNSSVLTYSLLYGISYTAAMVGMFKAYQIGSVSLTAFIKQLSLIAVSFWGLLFWGIPLSVNVIIGLMLIIGALYLCFKPDKNAKVKVSLRWCIYALMLLMGNAGCSIIQKYQQMAFDGNFGNMFMLFGTAAAFLVSLAFYLANFKNKPCGILKRSLFYPVIGGISSALLNLLILLLISSDMLESVIFPGIAVGGLTFTLLFSILIYREKLTKLQWCGISVGIVALVFLNLG